MSATADVHTDVVLRQLYPLISAVSVKPDPPNQRPTRPIKNGMVVVLLHNWYIYINAEIGILLAQCVCGRRGGVYVVVV